MNKNRVLVGLFLAVVVAIMLSAYVYRAFQQATAVRPSNTQRVVVATTPLPLGTRLDSSNIRTIAWPGDSPVPGMLTSIESAQSRAVIAPVAANEMILESKLAPKEAGAGLPAAIPEGMRAISVAVNEVIGVAGFVTPGTSVDVLVTGQIPGATPKRRPVCHANNSGERPSSRRWSEDRAGQGRKTRGGSGCHPTGHSEGCRHTGNGQHRGKNPARSSEHH